MIWVGIQSTSFGISRIGEVAIKKNLRAAKGSRFLFPYVTTVKRACVLHVDFWGSILQPDPSKPGTSLAVRTPGKARRTLRQAKRAQSVRGQEKQTPG